MGPEAMKKPKIAVVISTTREGRFGDTPARWIYDIAAARGDMELELIDLRDYPMPFFDEPSTNAWVPAKNAVALRWQKKVAEFDGYIFVTSEYNRGVPGVFKNALDYAYVEWNRKTAACVGYGSVGAARAVAQLQLTCIELQLAPIRTSVHIQGADFYALLDHSKTLDEVPYIEKNATAMLDDFFWWTNALVAARQSSV
jgi:NAD(P)H-dependent FMN reductase